MKAIYIVNSGKTTFVLAKWAQYDRPSPIRSPFSLNVDKHKCKDTPTHFANN